MQNGQNFLKKMSFYELNRLNLYPYNRQIFSLRVIREPQSRISAYSLVSRLQTEWLNRIIT